MESSPVMYLATQNSTPLLARPIPPQFSPVVAPPFVATPQKAPMILQQATDTKNKVKKSNTLGMNLFDLGLYPVFTNGFVLGTSVLFTYLTNYGKEGNWFKQRGDLVRHLLTGKATLPVIEKLSASVAEAAKNPTLLKKISKPGIQLLIPLLSKFKMSKASADMAVMVLFSFIDGSIASPLVQWVERHRNQISKWLDRKMGTTPTDDTVYTQEPERNGQSIWAGRATAVLTVVPTAVVLDKQWFGLPALNDVLFSNPGKKLGEWIERNVPAIQRALPSLHLSGLFKTLVFEAFYTALTTATFYFSGKRYAALQKQHRNQALNPAPSVRNGANNVVPLVRSAVTSPTHSGFSGLVSSDASYPNQAANTNPFAPFQASTVPVAL